MEINSSNNSLESFSEADFDFKPPIMKANTFAKLNLNNLNISQELENYSEISSIDINEPQITPTNNNNKFLKEIIPSEPNNNKNKKHKKLNKEDLNNTPLPIFSCIYCSNENVSFSHLSREILSENAQNAYKKAKETVKEIQDKADDAVEEMQKKGEEIISKIQGFIDKQKENV